MPISNDLLLAACVLAELMRGRLLTLPAAVQVPDSARPAGLAAAAAHNNLCTMAGGSHRLRRDGGYCGLSFAAIGLGSSRGLRRWGNVTRWPC